MIKKFRSENYNQDFDTETGLHKYWGKTEEENPSWCEFGPSILDIEISSGRCKASCEFCLPSGSLIVTENGNLKIEEVISGQNVLAFNTHSSSFEKKSVIETYTRNYEGDLIVIETEDGRVLKLTPNHPVLTTLGWKDAYELTVEDEVIIYG